VVGNGEPLVFRSRFNYHGFRYVRVIGTAAAPAVSDATGHLIRTAYERAGDFTSSNDLLNRIYQMTTRTYEALTLGGYVVDCPTRERLGYGGDAGTSRDRAQLLDRQPADRCRNLADSGPATGSPHLRELLRPGGGSLM
jgi:alpha-L-rhamnosidase